MADAYVKPEALKKTLNLSGTSFVDDDVDIAVVSASQAIDGICDRSFVPADMSNESGTVRYFTPQRPSTQEIDDAVEIVEVAVDYTGRDDFADAWVENQDFVLEPLNAAAKDRPYERIRVTGSLSRRIRGFPMGVPRSVRVTARWGWVETPEAIVDACSILATRIVKRKREAPFGIVTAGIDVGTAIRIARSDPDVMMLLDGGKFIRETWVA